MESGKFTLYFLDYTKQEFDSNESGLAHAFSSRGVLELTQYFVRVSLFLLAIGEQSLTLSSQDIIMETKNHEVSVI